MLAAAVPTVELDESAMRVLEGFTGLKLSRTKLPLLWQDIGTAEVLEHRVRTVLGPMLEQTIKAVREAGEGEVFDRFVAQTVPFVRKMAETADLLLAVIEAEKKFFLETETGKRTAVAMFSFMQAEFAAAAAMWFWNPVGAAAHVAQTRSIIQAVLRSAAVRSAASGTAVQMLFMPGSALLAEVSMMTDGLQSGVNWSAVGKQAAFAGSVAFLSTVAGPAMGKVAGAVAAGVSKLGVPDAIRPLLVDVLTRPVLETGGEVIFGIGAEGMVTGHVNLDNVGADATSGAFSGAAGSVAGTVGAAAGFAAGRAVTQPRVQVPRADFTPDGRPVLPVGPRPVGGDTSAGYQSGVGDPKAAGTGGQAAPPTPPPTPPPLPAVNMPVPKLNLPMPTWVPSWSSLSVPAAPAPQWVVAAGAPVVEQWYRFQQDLVDRYGGLLAGVARAGKSMAALAVPIERVFAGWVDARQGDPTVAAFLSAVGLPGTALTEEYLTGVRERAVARMAEALASAGEQIPAEVWSEQVIDVLPAAFDLEALREIAHLAAEHHIDRYLAAGLPTAAGTSWAVGTPTGAGVPAGAGAAVPSAAAIEAVKSAVRNRMDRILDAILDTSALPAVVASPDAAQVNAVANAVRQTVTDLPARFTAAAIPDTTAAHTVASPADIPAHRRADAPPVPVTPEQHTAAANRLAVKQFAALAHRYYGVDPANHGTLVRSFQEDWVKEYHQVLAQAAGSAAPATPGTPAAPSTPSMPGTSGTASTPGASGTPDAAGARSTVPGGAAPDIDGTPHQDRTSDRMSDSAMSVFSDDVFSGDSSSTDTVTSSALSSPDEPISADSGSLGEPAVAATGPAAAAIGSAVDSGTASRPGAASGPAGSSSPADLGLAAAHGPAAERIHNLASGGHGHATDAQLRRLAADIGIQAASPDEVLPQLFEAARDIAMADTFSGVYFADPAMADLDTAAADHTAAQALPWVQGWFTIAGHRNLAERLAHDPVRQALFLRTLTASPAWQHAVAQAQQQGGDTPDIMLVWCDAAWQGPGQATSFGEWLRTQLRARRLMSSTHEVDQIPGELRPHADEPVRSVLFSDGSVELFGPDLVEAVRTADIVENGQEPGVSWPDQQDFTAAGGQHRWAGSTSDGQSPDPTENGPDQPQPQPTANPQVRDPDGAWTLFNQHIGHITTTTQHQEQPLRQLWDVLINSMDGEGYITVSEEALAGETGTVQATVNARIVALRAHRLLELDQGARGREASRYKVTDPGTRQALPAPPEGCQWVRNQNDAWTLFEQHVGHDTRLRPLWNALIREMNDNGIITASMSTLATETGTGKTTVHRGIKALRARRLLHPVEERHGRMAAQYGVTDPGPPQPRQTRARRRGRYRCLLPGPLNDPGASTASFWPEGWAEPAEPDPAGPLDPLDPLDSAWGGLPTAVGTGLYPGPQPVDLSLPQALPDPTWWSRSSGDQPSQLPGMQSLPPGPGVQDPASQLPMSGSVPAPPAVAGLPGLPGLLDDPRGASTASFWPEGPAASSWPEGWLNPGIDVTTWHGAGMSTDPGQQHINNQPDDGGNLGDWAIYPGTEMDWEPYPAPSPAVTRTDAGTLHAGDTLHHPADEPPTPAPLHPDQPQPQPQPTAGLQWVRDPDGAWTLFNQHIGHITATTQYREQPLRELWDALIRRMDEGGFITASESTLAEATGTVQQTVNKRIGVLRAHRLLELDQGTRGGEASRYKVTVPDPPRQALPDPPEGRQWVLDRDDARTLFEQHIGHITTTTRLEEQPLRELWNALIDQLDGDGLITASEPALADATRTARPTVRGRIVALRNRRLLWLDQEKRGRVAARYRVTDPGPPLPQAPPGPTWWPQSSGDQSSQFSGTQSLPPGPGVQEPASQLPMSGSVPAPPAGTGLLGLPGPLGDRDVPTASSWQAGWAGWAGPAWPNPDIDMTAHGAGMSTDFDQPPIDNQPDDDSGNPGAWATWQGRT
ncbi:hypothetical protein [Micromonospora sp. NPDC048830]|uniref:hypothetical protein n=1 Tax=Micromonospora sp. NPDC048830 TaxID=3364257 RepID=UPI00371E9AAF